MENLSFHFTNGGIIMNNSWNGFKKGDWVNTIDVSDFIRNNYTEYTGDSSFLEGPVDSSLKLNEAFKDLLVLEKEKGGVIDLDTKVPSTIVSHKPGYINKNLETIVGLQTDAPLKEVFSQKVGLTLL